MSAQADKKSNIEQYFQVMAKAGASDLHFKPGRTPYIRVKSQITAAQGKALTAEDLDAIISDLTTDEQAKQFLKEGHVDLAYELSGADRFRINIFRQRGFPALAVRRVTREIPDFEQLNVAPSLSKIAESHKGLVLLSGPTGSGKSTTIAAMLEHINKTRPCHIVTIEDPIEYLYEDKKALINQREIGIDASSFEAALKALMREDPDVVLIGEMRDHETFQAALQASETGHLVFGTVHASTAAQTIGRILDLFPSDSRHLIRQSLAFNLNAIICQMLLPSVDDSIGRIPTQEIMINNPSIRQLILEQRDNELPDVIRACEQDGMQSFTTSLLALIEKDLIDPKVAYSVAPNVEELKMAMKGISSGRSGLIGRG